MADLNLIVRRGIRDVMPADPYAKTRFRAAKQADEDMRRDEPLALALRERCDLDDSSVGWDA